MGGVAHFTWRRSKGLAKPGTRSAFGKFVPLVIFSLPVRRFRRRVSSSTITDMRHVYCPSAEPAWRTGLFAQKSASRCRRVRGFGLAGVQEGLQSLQRSSPFPHQAHDSMSTPCCFRGAAYLSKAWHIHRRLDEPHRFSISASVAENDVARWRIVRRTARRRDGRCTRWAGAVGLPGCR